MIRNIDLKHSANIQLFLKTCTIMNYNIFPQAL